MTERVTEKPRKPARVLIQAETDLENADGKPCKAWLDECDGVSTAQAERWLREHAEAGLRYRIVTVHREVTASIEQREPKIRLA